MAQNRPNTPSHPTSLCVSSLSLVFGTFSASRNSLSTDHDGFQPLWNLFLLLVSVPSHAFLVRFLWGGQGSPPQRVWEVRAALAVNVLPLVAGDLTRYVLPSEVCECECVRLFSAQDSLVPILLLMITMFMVSSFFLEIHTSTLLI